MALCCWTNLVQTTELRPCSGNSLWLASSFPKWCIVLWWLISELLRCLGNAPQLSSVQIVFEQSSWWNRWKLSVPKASQRRQRQGTKTPSVTELEKKTLGETRLSRGASSPLARWTSSSIPSCRKVRLCRGLIWFPWSCANGHLGGVVFARDLSLGTSSCPGLRWHSGL